MLNSKQICIRNIVFALDFIIINESLNYKCNFIFQRAFVYVTFAEKFWNIQFTNKITPVPILIVFYTSPTGIILYKTFEMGNSDHEYVVKVYSHNITKLCCV